MSEVIVPTEPKIPMRKPNPPWLMYFSSPDTWFTVKNQCKHLANFCRCQKEKFDLPCHHPSSQLGFFLSFFFMTLGNSGRTCIFFWHLKKQTNKTPSWSLFELRQSYWIKYMPRNTTSLICIEKSSDFSRCTAFTLHCGWSLIQVSLPQFYQKKHRTWGSCCLSSGTI